MVIGLFPVWSNGEEPFCSAVKCPSSKNVISQPELSNLLVKKYLYQRKKNETRMDTVSENVVLILLRPTNLPVV